MKLEDKADAFEAIRDIVWMSDEENNVKPYAALDIIKSVLKPPYEALKGSEYYKHVEYRAEDIKRLIDLCEDVL